MNNNASPLGPITTETLKQHYY